MSATHPGHVLISSWGRTEGEGTSSSQHGTGHWGFLGDDANSALQGASALNDSTSGSQQKKDGRRLGTSGSASTAAMVEREGSRPLPSGAAAAQAAEARRRISDAAEGSASYPGTSDQRLGHRGALFPVSHAASQPPDGPDLRSFERQDSLTDQAEAAVRRLEEGSDGEPMAVSG